MRHLIFIAFIFFVGSCGIDNENGTHKGHFFPSDVSEKEAADFWERLGTHGWTTAKSPEERPLEELFSFDRGSTALAGSMKYATSDASGEWSLELISRREFSWEQSEWVGWIFKSGLIESKTSYNVVCHQKSPVTTSIRYFGYDFVSVTDCFGDISKELVSGK